MDCSNSDGQQTKKTTDRQRMLTRRKIRLFHLLALLVFLCSTCSVSPAFAASGLQETVRLLASFNDRSVGNDGNRRAAEYIRSRLQAAEPKKSGTIDFLLPILKQDNAALHLAGKTLPLHPLAYNAITPENLAPEGLSGPLIYAGRGELADFNGKKVQGAIVLMEFDSMTNWLNAASLGASALIYINRGISPRSAFAEKEELSPIQFPCFWVEAKQLATILPGGIKEINTSPPPEATVTGQAAWTTTAVSNLYALFAGTDPDKADQLVVVEAFYDATSFIQGRAPGADEALSIAGLLTLADSLHKTPPTRPFLLLASNGHSMSQAGMRESIWAISSRSKDLRKTAKLLKADRKKSKAALEVLQQFKDGTLPKDAGALLQKALNHPLKMQVDSLSTTLMQLRMEQKNSPQNEERINRLSEERLRLRHLGWRTDLHDLDEKDRALLDPLTDMAINRYRLVQAQTKQQVKMLKSAKRFRSMMADFEPRALISLHLSSHGSGVGAFHQGFLYPLRPIINRTAAFRTLDSVLLQAAANAPPGLPTFISTLRPNRLQPWQDLLPDKPQMAGEVTCLAGLPGITLATTEDLRNSWGTPWDTVDRIDWDFADRQWQLVERLIQGIDQTADPLEPGYIRNGFATVAGRTSLLLHGELFAEHPAESSVLLAFQGPARYHAITDLNGRFLLKGVADKKHVRDKVILEGYRFSKRDGSVLWAIDKKITGKPAYRVKMRRRDMKTDLVMFNCRQTTIFNLLEPRSLQYMTKLQLIDARRDAPPIRYWYSRIDTRSSIIASIFLAPETRLKLTLSDSVLQKKMILTNATPEDPLGTGYRVDDHPSLFNTSYLVARDMWDLLTPRINNLEAHGIHNQRINGLHDQGIRALERAGKALAEYRYDVFSEESSRSWALASRVYDHVEKTQKDVLFGVLFYIALFVPFAFCAERLLFGFVSIYKRILGFSGILLVLILVVARVHPAFELAYSPTVVILAFFIIGLSALVTMIIILRFEDEMTLLQRRTSHKRPAEISSWKAFTAAFFLGVSNLRRRRLRTALTCLTLIILTFTIMSFTTVKSMRRQNRLQISTTSPYKGLLLKHMNWKDLPMQSLSIFQSLFNGQVLVGPRVWLVADEPTRAGRIQISVNGTPYIFQGMTGLSPREPTISGLNKILIKGRWFNPQKPNEILIPSRLAKLVDIDPDKPDQPPLILWGQEFQVVGVFSEKKLQQLTDLDGEPLTPATFPSETVMEMTEVEKEAMESGEDVQAFQGRYHHLDPSQVLILPADTLLQLGGTIKSVALHPTTVQKENPAPSLSDRFNLALFQGEQNGVFLYNASDTMSYSGMPNILIPLLISILIVLNTMISSVFERKREIAVYTSVGLAPSHVSFLFVAEALAFAVLSGVLGYLLAQSSAAVLAGTSLWQGITVNYSSTAGIAAMVLVMGVVLLSVIYPSKMAAKIAIPDVNRTWTLPSPVNDTMSVTLPFLMHYHEHASICGFLYSFLKGHQDVSHGIFATGPIEVVDAAALQDDGDRLPMVDDCVHLRAKIWLAPFDFGIMQWIDLRFCKAGEGNDFLEINVRMERRAGEAGLWQRLNGPFLHSLRKQLLIWRSLDAEGHAQYSRLLPELTPGKGKNP
ncbi:MAG TPA: FtsX-like permease family protein [Desulfobulbus sp.]|nr:FtsX-like permease family protein [Desulfobulbus sp.]